MSKQDGDNDARTTVTLTLVRKINVSVECGPYVGVVVQAIPDERFPIERAKKLDPLSSFGSV